MRKYAAVWRTTVMNHLVYTADVLFRAAAFAHVVATGRAVLDVPAAEASRMRTLADQLESAARQELAQQLG